MDIIWIGVAFIFGLMVARIHIPPLVGYLLAGLLLSFVGYEEGPILKEIAHLGVVFLLFTVGLHIKLKNIVQLEVIGPGLIHLAISSAIFLPICLYFGLNLEAAVIISITLGFSSTVLAAKNLETRGELGAYYGRIAIGILILQDLVAIGIIAYAGGGIPSPWAVVLLGLPLLRPAILWLLNQLQRDELLLLMALSLSIGGEALFVQFNLSGELGALVMGMLLAGKEKGEALEKKIWGVKEAFLVGFFLQIGLSGFPEASTWWVVGVFTILLPLKATMFFFLFMIFKLRARTGFQSTITLTAYSEFTLIAGAVAASANLIPMEWIVILALITAISYILNAILVKNEDNVWELMNGILARFQRSGKTSDKQLTTLGSAEFLILGMGVAGVAAYDFLKDKNELVVGLDLDPDRIKRELENGRRVVYGDVQDISLWETLDLSKVKTILIAMSSLGIDLKTHAVRMLRGVEYKGSIIVSTLNENEEHLVRESGGIPVSIPARDVGEKMAKLCLK
jgi:predicted Kef-type K+ transport protein